MTRNIRIQATSAGSDTGPFKIYHTSVAPFNLLRDNVQRSELLTGVYLAGIDDSYVNFIVESTGACLSVRSINVPKINTGGQDIYIGSNSGSFPTDVCYNFGDLSDKYILDESISFGTMVYNNIETTIRFNGHNRWWYCDALSRPIKISRKGEVIDIGNLC